MRKTPSSMMAIMAVLMLILAACNGGGESPSASTAESGEPTQSAAESAPGSAAPSEPATGLAACGEEDSGDALLIGGVTDVGQLEDKSFNEGGWCGTIAGATAVGGSADVIVTEDPADYQNNMQTFIDQGYDVIVTYGFALGNDTAIAAKANPEIQFIGLDQAICVDENGDPDPTFACAGDAAALLPNYQGLIFAEAQHDHRDERHRHHRRHRIGPTGQGLHRRLRQRRQVGQPRRRGARLLRVRGHHNRLQRPDHGRVAGGADDRAGC
jgi:hypothetical protein